jgi:hypothetical protein
MKFKVGQVWEDGNGEAIRIESVTGEVSFRDVLQPVVGRDTSGCIWNYTENGHHGHTEECLRVDNLVRLISEPAEEAEPEVSEETDTPPVTLELMQEFTTADTELCELANGLQDRGAKFEKRGNITGTWLQDTWRFSNGWSSYRMVSLPPADEPASKPTIEPGEEFGPEKFELAKTYPPGEFEYWDTDFGAWVPPFDGSPGWSSSDRYRRKPESQEQTTESVAAVPTKRRLKVMIVGHGRHGKDTVAQILADELGLTFCSSSYFCAKAFIYDALKNVFGYRSIAECYEDRNTSQRMRDLWHTLICAYNRDDPARLSREILSEHDIYVGIRSDEEFAEAELEGLFDLSIWVDASERLQLEDESSFEIERSDCDIVIDNNYSEEDLIRRVTRLAAAMDVSQ